MEDYSWLRDCQSIGITGGTGTLGHALVDKILSDIYCANIERIVIFSRDEVKQAQMSARIKRRFIPESFNKLRFFIGDVRDEARLRQAFDGLDVVIHAAALKRIDSVAYDPEEVLKTNVWGTRNALHAAQAVGVKQVVVVSTDKGVEPTNVYGATKMMAEHLTVAFNSYSAPKGTRCAVVRYGNVLGSRGSFFPTWVERVKRRQKIELTDTEMTRYVLFPVDAAELILYHVLRDMASGEIFVPICPAVRMKDALAMFLSLMDGKGFGESLEYGVSGLRLGGEKMHERLVLLTELPRTYACWRDSAYSFRKVVDKATNRRFGESREVVANRLLMGVMTIHPEIHPWREPLQPRGTQGGLEDFATSETMPKLSDTALYHSLLHCLTTMEAEDLV